MDEEKLNALRRDLQECKSQLLELSSRVTQLENRIITLSEVIESWNKH